jgi:hypothetical protein
MTLSMADCGSPALQDRQTTWLAFQRLPAGWRVPSACHLHGEAVSPSAQHRYEVSMN